MAAWRGWLQIPARRQPRGAVLVALLATLAAELTHRAGWLEGVDAFYSDAWHRLAGVRFPPRHVALVAVDQAALDAHPDEPLAFWGPHFARVAQRLHEVGVRAVALDFLLAVSPDGWLQAMPGGASLARVYDAELRNAIGEGRLLLVGSVGRPAAPGQTTAPQTADFLTLPHPDYLFAIPDLALSRYLGLADLRADRDGVVRRFRLREPLHLGPDYASLDTPSLTLPALLAQHQAGLDPAAPSWTLAGRTLAVDTTLHPISFAGPPNTVPRLSFARLEADGYADDPEVRALAGKVVIIGAHFAGMGDAHFTPYATSFDLGQGRLMSGAEVHAQIVETLLSGRASETVPATARICGSALAAGLVLAGMLFLPLAPASAATLVWLALGAVLSYLAFQSFWLVSTASWQLAALAGYVGGLALLFTGEARQRGHLARLFSRYISNAGVRTLLASDTMPELGGKRYEVTVLFSDIRNFTTISEALAPEEVVEMLNEYFERACQPVLDEGGSIDKFIGDAIMAEFGSPLPAEDHALRAVRAGLAMVAEGERFRQWMTQRFPNRGLPEFAIGVGIHTGPAILGSIGSSLRSEFTAIGDTVNVASRLEGVTKELHAPLVISQQTLTAAGPSLQCGSPTTTQVKGHRQPIQVYPVIGIADVEV